MGWYVFMWYVSITLPLSRIIHYLKNLTRKIVLFVICRSRTVFCIFLFKLIKIFLGSLFQNMILKTYVDCLLFEKIVMSKNSLRATNTRFFLSTEYILYNKLRFFTQSVIKVVTFNCSLIKNIEKTYRHTLLRFREAM